MENHSYKKALAYKKAQADKKTQARKKAQVPKMVQVGLIGAGIQASHSPHMHESEARALGFACSYQLLDIKQLGVSPEALPDLLAQVERQGFAGVNITHPFKQAVIPLLDELSADAAAIGAVNTVVFDAGKRFGHNTDCTGFAESFRRAFANVPRHRVVLLGAGGAGSAVAHAALQQGVECLAVYDTDAERAALLVERLCTRFGAPRATVVTNLAAALAEADGLIQATTVGMTGHAGMPLAVELLRSDLWVAEIICFPLETDLLKAARKLGCLTLDGSGMNVFQAVEAFRLFTGVAPDDKRMRRHFTAR